MEKAKRGMSPVAVILDEKPDAKVHSLIGNQSYWHKIVVLNTYKLSKNKLLRALMIDLQPYDLVPICYEEFDECASFLVQTCAGAICSIQERQFVLNNIEDHNHKFNIRVIVAFAYTSTRIKEKLQQNIESILQTKFNKKTGMLDLSNFHECPNLKEYTPLSQRKLLLFVTYLSRQFKVRHLDLSNNEIRYISSECWSNLDLENLVSLNLSKNLIESIESLHFNHNLINLSHIQKLWIDGNPLCMKYEEWSYVKTFKDAFPKLNELDGIPLSGHTFLAYKTNYVCSIKGVDFVNQFLEHYFAIFDSNSRHHLENTYHTNAMFSITAEHISGPSSSPCKFDAFLPYTRNIKTIVNWAYAGQNIFVGNKNIIGILLQLPQCIHNPKVFTVDLQHFTDNSAILSVTGVFQGNEQIAYYYGFIRTFVIKRDGISREFKITNDQWHIYNAFICQEKRFKNCYVPYSSKCSIPIPKTINEKLLLSNVYQYLTNLQSNCATKFLEEYNYDLADALVYATELFRKDHLSLDIFRSKAEYITLLDINTLIDSILYIKEESTEENISCEMNKIMVPTNIKENCVLKVYKDFTPEDVRKQFELILSENKIFVPKVKEFGEKLMSKVYDVNIWILIYEYFGKAKLIRKQREMVRKAANYHHNNFDLNFFEALVHMHGSLSYKSLHPEQGIHLIHFLKAYNNKRYSKLHTWFGNLQDDYKKKQQEINSFFENSTRFNNKSAATNSINIDNNHISDRSKNYFPESEKQNKDPLNNLSEPNKNKNEKEKHISRCVQTDISTNGNNPRVTFLNKMSEKSDIEQTDFIGTQDAPNVDSECVISQKSDCTRKVNIHNLSTEGKKPVTMDTKTLQSNKLMTTITSTSILEEPPLKKIHLEEKVSNLKATNIKVKLSSKKTVKKNQVLDHRNKHSIHIGRQ